MSREDPQFKLRMPQALRDQAEQAAKSASRSLNAELVARLEKSFLSNAEPKELMPAERARELAAIAREG
ncbi:Arc family DNA-binding protein, partial [Pseudomonas nicosulfuronedens]